MQYTSKVHSIFCTFFFHIHLICCGKNNWTLESLVVVFIFFFYFELDGSVMGIEWFVVDFYRWNKRYELHFSVFNVIPLEKNFWLFTVLPEKKKKNHHHTEKKRTFFCQQPIGIECAKNEKKKIKRIIKNQQHFVFITQILYILLACLCYAMVFRLLLFCSFLFFLLESHFCCVSLFTRSFDFVFRHRVANAFHVNWTISRLLQLNYQLNRECACYVYAVFFSLLFLFFGLLTLSICNMIKCMYLKLIRWKSISSMFFFATVWSKTQVRV